MNRFLYHTSCDNCGSSDAKAVYSQGDSFCFSCRKPTASKVSPYVSMHQVSSRETNEDNKSVLLPPDANQHYSQGAVDWAAKYEISVTQLLKEGVVYSKGRNQLIFPWYDGKGNLLAWQARNLSPVNKSKRYFTKGDVNEILPIYREMSMVSLARDFCSSDSELASVDILVLVEDCLSAIKIASLGIDAMPLLGSGISLKKLTRLRPFYDVLAVFLDPDMWHKSLVIAQQASMLGFNTRSIKGEKDPKEYPYLDLKGILKDLLA